MEVALNYLYPDRKNASNIKVFQEETSKIRAFYFKRDFLDKCAQLSHSHNYGVYFLFNESEDLFEVYIGKSTQGINRIRDHSIAKGFWSYCIMFVSDNHSFDTNTIDYLEHHFINKFVKSGEYSVKNKDIRHKEPNLSDFRKAGLKALIRDITFLLEAEGIEFLELEKMKASREYFYPSSPTYKTKAKIFVQSGKFILATGSIIKGPPSGAENWNDKHFYKRNQRIIDEYLAQEKIKPHPAGYEALVDLTFKKPSPIADLITGSSENGWLFFEGLATKYR